MLEALITDILSSGNPVRFRAPGHSMAPLIRSNDTLIVRPIDPAAISPGDILLYRSGTGLTAHRVVAALPEAGAGCSAPGVPGFLLKGDACSGPDAPVPACRVLGRVVAVERDGRCIDPYRLPARVRAGLHRFASRLKSRLRSAV